MNEVLLGELLSGKGVTYGVVKPGDHTPHGIPLIKAADVGNGRVNSAPNFRISQEKHQEHSRTELDGGELLITLVGTPGQCAIAPSEVKGFNVVRAVGVFSTEPTADSRFIMYSIQAPQSQVYLRNVCNTTVQATLNLGDLKGLPLSIPDIKEQKAIAHILGTLDHKIELNRKTNETLEAMAKALFKSWFVDFDPVRVKAEGRPTGLPAEISDLFPDSFEDSELGEIPIGWRVMELGMVSTFLNGYAFKSSDWQEHGVPVVKIGSVKPGFVDVDNVSFVSDEIAASKDRYRLSPGDILIGMTGYVGEVGLVPISESPPLLNQRVGRVAPMSDAIVSRSFLYNWMRTSTFKDSVEVLSHGSAQANVSSDSIQSIPHAIPSSDIERAFASICEPILDRLLEGHREQKLLANIRDALLPKLISGEIRIPDAEKMLDEVGV